MDDQAKRDDDETEGDESRGRPPKDGGMGPLVNCKLPCQILAASRRNSGKSTLVASLLYQWLKMGRFKSHNIIIFSATAAHNDEYAWLPKENVCHDRRPPPSVRWQMEEVDSKD